MKKAKNTVEASRVSLLSTWSEADMTAGRTLREVCAARELIKTFNNEKAQFRNWEGDTTEVGEAKKMAVDSKRKKRKR